MDRSVATCPKGATGGEHQKHDGRRRLVLRRGTRIVGINRRGLVVAIPEPIHKAIASMPCDVLIDGEAIGDTVEATDLDSAIQAGRERCLADWNDETGAPFTMDDIHCLGIAGGDIKILHWEDQSE
jgi:hypothetical protein